MGVASSPIDDVKLVLLHFNYYRRNLKDGIMSNQRSLLSAGKIHVSMKCYEYLQAVMNNRCLILTNQMTALLL